MIIYWVSVAIRQRRRRSAMLAGRQLPYCEFCRRALIWGHRTDTGASPGQGLMPRWKMEFCQRWDVLACDVALEPGGELMTTQPARWTHGRTQGRTEGCSRLRRPVESMPAASHVASLRFLPSISNARCRLQIAIMLHRRQSLLYIDFVSIIASLTPTHSFDVSFPTANAFNERPSIHRRFSEWRLSYRILITKNIIRPLYLLN